MTIETNSGFAAYPLAAPIAAALKAADFTTPTPIQAQAIPPLMDGRDIIGIAQTGTGKTAAFALPMLHRLAVDPKRPTSKTARMVVLSPTRELAIQIADTFRTLGKGLRFSIATIFGGVGERPQIDAAARGIDVLVATPGRLLDLVERRFINFSGTEVFVLDEADRMLDMGFIRDVRKLVKLLPRERHSLMFSATMPPAIREVAEEMLSNPVQVTVTPKVVTVERIAQSVFHVPAKNKRPLLLELLTDAALDKVVVFCRTKHGANKVSDFLEKYGVASSAIHGNKSQGARQAALGGFRDGRVRVLVATDIMARGIDVPDISHVINFELPEEPESYVHRIGRTGRAGRDGIAISFCDPAERQQLKQIERLTKVTLEVRTHGPLPELVEPARKPEADRAERRGEGGQRDQRRDQERPRSHRGDRPQRFDDRRDQRPPHAVEGRDQERPRSHRGERPQRFDDRRDQRPQHAAEGRDQERPRHQPRGERPQRFDDRRDQRPQHGAENRSQERPRHYQGDRDQRHHHQGEREPRRDDRREARPPHASEGRRPHGRDGHAPRTEQRRDRREHQPQGQRPQQGGQRSEGQGGKLPGFMGKPRRSWRS